jgi:hypothetical protein
MLVESVSVWVIERLLHECYFYAAVPVAAFRQVATNNSLQLLPRSAHFASGRNEVMHMDNASRRCIKRYRSESFHRSSSSVGQY